MNVEITDKVANELFSWLQATGDFVAEQAPDVANQIVTFGLISNTAGAIIFLAVFCASAYGVYKATRCYDRYTDWPIAVGVCGSFAGVFSFILVMITGYQAILAYFAPKLYIMNYISTLVK